MRRPEFTSKEVRIDRDTRALLQALETVGSPATSKELQSSTGLAMYRVHAALRSLTDNGILVRSEQWRPRLFTYQVAK